MSRRYGRRQKRAALERQEMLELSLDIARSSLAEHRIALRSTQDHFMDLKQRIIEWDADIRSMLGPYTSFAIDDTTFRVDHPDHLREMQIMPRLPDLDFMSDRMVAESVGYYVERVLHLLMRLNEQDIMTLSRYLSLQLNWGSDRESSSVYAMSESYWLHLQQADGSGRARAVRHIAEDMLRAMIEGEKKKMAERLRAAQSRPRVAG